MNTCITFPRIFILLALVGFVAGCGQGQIESPTPMSTPTTVVPTVVPTATLIPIAIPNVSDPCLLVTAEMVKEALGLTNVDVEKEDLQETGRCIYYGETEGNSFFVFVNILRGDKGREYLLKTVPEFCSQGTAEEAVISPTIPAEQISSETYYELYPALHESWHSLSCSGYGYTPLTPWRELGSNSFSAEGAHIFNFEPSVGFIMAGNVFILGENEMVHISYTNFSDVFNVNSEYFELLRGHMCDEVFLPRLDILLKSLQPFTQNAKRIAALAFGAPQAAPELAPNPTASPFTDQPAGICPVTEPLGIAPVAVFQGNIPSDAFDYHAVFSPNGDRILTTGKDGIARLWDFEGNELAVMDSGEEVGQYDMLSGIFSPDGTRILTAKDYGTAHLWDVEGNKLAVFGQKFGLGSFAMFSPDGSRIITTDAEDKVQLWDSEGNPVVELSGNYGVFGPTGNTVLTVNDDNTARLWDGDGNPLAILKGHKDSISSFDFSPDGDKILTASRDGTVRLWDLEGNLLTVLKVVKTGAGYIDIADFSPDGSKIITATLDGTVTLFDNDGNKLVVMHPNSGVLGDVLFSSNGNRILTTDPGGTAQLWDAKGYELAVLEDEETSAGYGTFNFDGERIITTTWNNTARLWDADGNLLAVLQGHTGVIDTAVFSPDDKYILTASEDGTAMLWQVP